MSCVNSVEVPVCGVSLQLDLDNLELPAGGGGIVQMDFPGDLYVAADGDDSNNGLSEATAFATLGKAFEALADRKGWHGPISVYIGPGQYEMPEEVNCRDLPGTARLVGLTEKPELSAPGNRIVVTGRGVFEFENVTLLCGLCGTHDVSLSVHNVKSITTKEAGDSLHAYNRSTLFISGNLDIVRTGSSGGTALCSRCGSYIHIDSSTVMTINGAFSYTFAAYRLSKIHILSGTSITGKVTAIRYNVTYNSMISVPNGATNFIPGNAAGATYSGSHYA